MCLVLRIMRLSEMCGIYLFILKTFLLIVTCDSSQCKLSRTHEKRIWFCVNAKFGFIETNQRDLLFEEHSISDSCTQTLTQTWFFEQKRVALFITTKLVSPCVFLRKIFLSIPSRDARIIINLSHCEVRNSQGKCDHRAKVKKIDASLRRNVERVSIPMVTERDDI